jgi:hypothetical protein
VIVSARHLTITGVPQDQNDPAIQAKVQNSAGNGLVNLVVNDSIIDGFDNPLWCEAPVSGSIGNAAMTINYSQFKHSANVIGDCTFNNSNTIDTFTAGAPKFVGDDDFHLLPSSPALDKGNPATVSLPTQDYDGAPRPIDGDGDGVARRDMGAYEYQPPGPPGDSGGNGPGDGTQPPQTSGPPRDTKAPVIDGLRLKRRTLEVTVSESASVEVTLRPSGTTQSKKAKRVLLRFKAKAGKNKFKLKRKKLKAGRYKLTAVATDAAGNRSKPKSRRIRIGR